MTVTTNVTERNVSSGDVDVRLLFPEMPGQGSFGDWTRDAPWARRGQYFITTYSRLRLAPYSPLQMEPGMNHFMVAKVKQSWIRIPPKPQTVQVQIRNADFLGPRAKEFILHTLSYGGDDVDLRRETPRPIWKSKGWRR